MKMVSLVVIVILNLFSPLGKSSVLPQRAPPLTYFTITECMTTSVILAYPIENDRFSNDSRRTRTFDRLLRRQLLYPTELASHVVVPIAADPEPPRESPQWYLNHLFIVADLNQIANPLGKFPNRLQGQVERWWEHY